MTLLKPRSNTLTNGWFGLFSHDCEEEKSGVYWALAAPKAFCCCLLPRVPPSLSSRRLLLFSLRNRYTHSISIDDSRKKESREKKIRPKVASPSVFSPSHNSFWLRGLGLE